MRAATVSERLAAILEPRQRVALLAEVLGDGSLEDTVALLAELLDRAGDSPAPHLAALDAALLVLEDSERLGYDRRAALYAEAVTASRSDVALLLLDVAPTVAGTEKLERELGKDQRLAPGGRALTLGERKSLARGHRRDVLLQLVRDPHPDVIAVLLDNPHLTEADVLRLASRRPMLGRSLAVVAACDRWRMRSAVRRALVLNPYSPAPLAARLMTTLADGDLARASCDPALDERLRTHAGELLAHRRARRGQRPV